MSDSPKVCVVLSGCGVFDGAEIHESVITLLALARRGATVTCAAPDKPQMHAPAVDQGIIGSFYSSFQPSAARRNSFVDPEGD